ncbi:MAG: DNA polymerase III subunit delta [Candidatus Amoebophilus sp. 36-38]|nr:MAG: DNA polymerase III subunit delta [Candidatus Amoebophilus sp. 36-38]
MPTMTAQQVLDTFKNGQYAPVYFLQGEEVYYIDCIIDYLEHQILDESEKIFNLTILYGKEHTISQVIAQAKQYPVGAERQVVIVKEAQDLQDLHRDAGQAFLINYLQSPNPTTILAFGYKHKTLSNKTTLSKVLVEQAIFTNSNRLYNNQLSPWITNYVTEKKMSISEKAIFMLEESVGSDLSRLAKELDKVILNLQPGDKITDTIIQEYVGISKQFNAFELQHAIASRDVYKANQIIFQLVDNAKNQVAIPLIALLFTFFSKILLLHQARDKSPQVLSQALQVNNYFIPQYMAASKKYSINKVIENINYLQEADMQLKGVAYPFVGEGEILKELVFKLLH